MTSAVRELPQPSTSEFHNNSTNSNSTSTHNTAPTAYIAELFDLYDHGIYHTPKDDCLPSCVAYGSKNVKHTRDGGLEFPDLHCFDHSGSFLNHPDCYRNHCILTDLKPGKLPYNIEVRKNKLKGVFNHIVYYLHKPFGHKIIVKDYVAREPLSPNERARIIKKLEKKNKQYHWEWRSERSTSTNFCAARYKNFLYAEKHGETQKRLLLLREQNSEKAPENPEVLNKVYNYNNWRLYDVFTNGSSSDKRATAIEKLEEAKKEHEQYTQYMKEYCRPVEDTYFDRSILRNNEYKISYWEQQIKLLQPQKENSETLV